MFGLFFAIWLAHQVPSRHDIANVEMIVQLEIINLQLDALNRALAKEWP